MILLVGQAAAKPRRPTIGRASIGGPALAFARWSDPTFHRRKVFPLTASKLHDLQREKGFRETLRKHDDKWLTA
jgi:hypothetical protein